MEDVNSTSVDKSYDSIMTQTNLLYYDYNTVLGFTPYVVTCVIIAIGLPLTLVAIYALYSLVRNDHVAPIFVINLLISDLIQLCCLIDYVAQTVDWRENRPVFYIYYFGLVSSVGFMVCVALERYLVIAHPLWYRFRRTIKVSVVVCVVVWAIAPSYFLTIHFFVNPGVTNIMFAVYLLLPFPLFIFFLGGTLKALSAASSVPSDEKRRIVGILVLVLLIYMLLFLPAIIFFLAEGVIYTTTFRNLSFIFLRMSPLADLTLYVFMRKGAIDKLLASVCCCRIDSNEISSSTVNDDTTVS